MHVCSSLALQIGLRYTHHHIIIINSLITERRTETRPADVTRLIPSTFQLAMVYSSH